MYTIFLPNKHTKNKRNGIERYNSCVSPCEFSFPFTLSNNFFFVVVSRNMRTNANNRESEKTHLYKHAKRYTDTEKTHNL